MCNANHVLLQKFASENMKLKIHLRNGEIMEEEKRRQIVEISGIAFTCFQEVMEHSSEEEKEFINNNFDIFINIFNHTVLTTYNLLKK